MARSDTFTDDGSEAVDVAVRARVGPDATATGAEISDAEGAAAVLRTEPLTSRLDRIHRHQPTTVRVAFWNGDDHVVRQADWRYGVLAAVTDEADGAVCADDQLILERGRRRAGRGRASAGSTASRTTLAMGTIKRTARKTERMLTRSFQDVVLGATSGGATRWAPASTDAISH